MKIHTQNPQAKQKALTTHSVNGSSSFSQHPLFSAIRYGPVYKSGGEKETRRRKRKEDKKKKEGGGQRVKRTRSVTEKERETEREEGKRGGEGRGNN